MTINHRVLLALGGFFMVLLAIATATQGLFGHSLVVIAFESIAAALLLYWAVL